MFLIVYFSVCVSSIQNPIWLLSNVVATEAISQLLRPTKRRTELERISYLGMSLWKCDLKRVIRWSVVFETWPQCGLGVLEHLMISVILLVISHVLAVLFVVVLVAFAPASQWSWLWSWLQ